MSKKGSGRRGNGAGSLIPVDGGYLARVKLPNGKYKGHRVKTKAEGQRWLTEQLHTLNIGGAIVTTDQTVKVFLEGWLARKKHDVEYGTWCTYRWRIGHVIRALGAVKLTKLTALQLSDFYNGLLDKGLKANYVRGIHTALKQALGNAEALELVARNVAARTPAPRAQETDRRAFTLEQLQTALDTAKASDDRLYALWLLLATTGMRQGEARALQWPDVDLAAGTVTINGTLKRAESGSKTKRVIGRPKTRSSRRVIQLRPIVVDALHTHKARQAQEKLASGLGDAWGGLAPARELVFTDRYGNDLEGGVLQQRRFMPLLERAGVPHLPIHCLRHTYATLALMAGEPLHVVSATLGHANPAMTLQVYAHVQPTMPRQAAETLRRDFLAVVAFAA